MFELPQRNRGMSERMQIQASCVHQSVIETRWRRELIRSRVGGMFSKGMLRIVFCRGWGVLGRSCGCLLLRQFGPLKLFRTRESSQRTAWCGGASDFLLQSSGATRIESARVRSSASTRQECHQTTLRAFRLFCRNEIS